MNDFPMFDAPIHIRIVDIVARPDVIHQEVAAPSHSPNEPNATASFSSLLGQGANEGIVQKPTNLVDAIFSQKDFFS